MNAQPQIFAQVRWALRGVEKKGDAFVDISIVGSTDDLGVGVPRLRATTSHRSPTRRRVSWARSRQTMFDAADATKKREYLAALAAVENPLNHTAETVACVACHVSTVVMNARAAARRSTR